MSKSKKIFFFSTLTTTLASIIFRTKFLNTAIQYNSSRPYKIAQVNILLVFYDNLVIEIFETKVVYMIYLGVDTSRHHGSSFLIQPFTNI